MGGSTTTTTTTIPPPSEEEKELTAKEVELADAQLAAIEDSTAFTKEYYKVATPLLTATAAFYEKEFDRLNDPDYIRRQDKYDAFLESQIDTATKNQDVYDEILQLELEDLKQGNKATDEEKALIKDAADAALESGTSDIQDAAKTALEDLRLELAPSLGLRPGDTAILDRGSKVAKEEVRQIGKLSSDLRNTEALATLNYPLAASKVYSDIGLGEQRLLDATSQFQSDLASTASANRLSLLGAGGTFSYNAGNLGLGLATGSYGSSALSSALGGYQRDRYASTTSTTSKSGGGFLDVLSAGTSLFGGIGGGLSGLSSSGLFK